MSAEFVANMEDVLDLYAEPYDPQRPVVCFDETTTQLLAETRPALPPRPGLPLRQDYEYRREGTRNLFLACEPLAGWREVAVTQRRTMQDFARRMRWLADEAYPEAEVVRVVLDNLNTHRRASLYETFPAEEARRIARRLEFHYTPKHGSWLNMEEIEFSVLSRSCLKQRLPGEEALRREVDALVTERNAARATINWRFNTRDARTKLHRLYPSDFTVLVREALLDVIRASGDLSPLSRMKVVLALDQAIELLLSSLLPSMGVSVRRDWSLPKMLSEICVSESSLESHRAPIERLRRLRDRVQHDGIVPSAEDGRVMAKPESTDGQGWTA